MAVVMIILCAAEGEITVRGPKGGKGGSGPELTSLVEVKPI